jgi:hypothetical protein
MATPPQDRPRRGRQPQSAGEPGPDIARLNDFDMARLDDFDVARLDDFEVIRERRNVMAALATLTDQYRALNHEMSTRQTLKWMVAS